VAERPRPDPESVVVRGTLRRRSRLRRRLIRVPRSRFLTAHRCRWSSEHGRAFSHRAAAVSGRTPELGYRGSKGPRRCALRRMRGTSHGDAKLAVNGGARDAEQLRDLGLGVLASIVHLEQQAPLRLRQFWLLSLQSPLARATAIPSRVRMLIRSRSNPATMASTLNSSRPTGSVGSYRFPPRLSATPFDRQLIRDLAHLSSTGRADRVSSRRGCLRFALRQALPAIPVGRDSRRSCRGRRRCAHRERPDAAVRRVGR